MYCSRHYVMGINFPFIYVLFLLKKVCKVARGKKTHGFAVFERNGVAALVHVEIPNDFPT